MATVKDLVNALAPRMLEAKQHIIENADRYLKASDLFDPLRRPQVLYLVRKKLPNVCLISWLYQERGFPKERIPFPIHEDGWPIFLVAARYPYDGDATYYIAKEAGKKASGRDLLLYWIVAGDKEASEAAKRLLRNGDDSSD